MSAERALFFILAALTVVLALRMVTTQRLVRSLVLHVGTLVSIGFVYLTIGAALMSAAQLMVYAGSVTILLVFALMLTPVGGSGESTLDHQSRLRAAITALAVLGVVTYALMSTTLASAVTRPTGVEAVATTLFVAYVYPFELLSAVLFATLVGVIVVASGSAEDRDSRGGEAA